MTIEEIFNKLAHHMKEGVMFHGELARAFDFLGLEGFAKMHNYHQCEEKQGYLCLIHYFSCHYHKLIQLEEIPTPKIIPDTWYKYTTMDVDISTKKSATKDMMDKWVTWERDTKKLYQEMRQALYTLGEVAAALKLDCYIKDVDDELIHAEKKKIKLETLNYDISTLISWSNSFKHKYKKKLGW